MNIDPTDFGLVGGEPATLLERALRDGSWSLRVRFADDTDRWVLESAWKTARLNGIAAALAVDAVRLRTLGKGHPAAVVALAVVESGGQATRSTLELLLRRLVAGGAQPQPLSTKFENWWKRVQPSLKESDLLRINGREISVNGPKRSLSHLALLSGECAKERVFIADQTIQDSMPTARLTTDTWSGASTGEAAVDTEPDDGPRQQALPPVAIPDDAAQATEAQPAQMTDEAQAQLGSSPTDAEQVTGIADGTIADPIAEASASQVTAEVSAVAVSFHVPAAAEGALAGGEADADAASTSDVSPSTLAAPSNAVQAAERQARSVRRPAGQRAITMSVVDRLQLSGTERGQVTRALAEAALASTADDDAVRVALFERPSLQRALLSEAAASGSPTAALSLLRDYVQRRVSHESRAILDVLRLVVTSLAPPPFTLSRNDSVGVGSLAGLLETAERLSEYGDPAGGARTARTTVLQELADASLSVAASAINVAELLAALGLGARHRLARRLVRSRPDTLLLETWTVLPALSEADRVALSGLLAEYVLETPETKDRVLGLVLSSSPGAQQGALLSALRARQRSPARDQALTRLLLAKPNGNELDSTQLRELMQTALYSDSPGWPFDPFAQLLTELISAAEGETEEQVKAAHRARQDAEARADEALRRAASIERDLGQVRSAAEQAVANARRATLPPMVRELAVQLKEQARLQVAGASPEQRLEMLSGRLLAIAASAGVQLGTTTSETDAITAFDPEQHESLVPGVMPAAPVRVLHPGFMHEYEGTVRRFLPALVTPV